MKQFSKLNEDTEQQDLAGKSAFNIFLELIHDLQLLFIKHDYLNQGDYSYFFTTEKIDDNYNVLGLLERKRSLRHAFLTLSQMKDERLSFYFGIKRKTLFYGFYNEDTKYVYKVGHFNTTTSYLKKIYSPSLKNVRKILENSDMNKMNRLHIIKKDLLELFPDFENEITVKTDYRIVKKFPVSIFDSNDLNEGRMEYTLLQWSRKYTWSKNVYSWVNLTEENAYFYIRMKDKNGLLYENKITDIESINLFQFIKDKNIEVVEDWIEYHIKKNHIFNKQSLLNILEEIINQFKNDSYLIDGLDLLIDKCDNDMKNRLLMSCAKFDVVKLALILINKGADVNFQHCEDCKNVLFSSISNDSFELTKELLKQDNIKTNIVINDDTALTVASKKFYSVNYLKPLLDVDIDWNYITKTWNGVNKTFLEFYEPKQREEIEKLYPEKYKNYLMNKNLEKYKI